MKNILSIFIGFILFVSSFVLLAWNEGNNARNISTALYMQKNAVQIESGNIEASNNNKLVALTGAVTTKDMLQDINIKMPETLVLERTVEMYQWNESEKTDSKGNTVYEYTKEWADERIDSDSFHDKQYSNPEFPIKSESFYASNAKLGNFDLTSKQIQKIASEKELIDLPKNNNYSIINGKYFGGKDFQNPEIGNIIISYRYAPSGTNISLIGKQKSNIITAFNYKGRSNYIQYNGSFDKDSIIEKYKQENKILTISLRILGFILMFIGLSLLISPVSRIFGFIPILGNIANNITSFILILISVVLSLITIAIAWLAYRPVISIMLILVSVTVVMLIKKIAKKNSDSK